MFLKKKNHTKRAIKRRMEVFKCIKILLYIPNMYAQDRDSKPPISIHEFRLD